MAIQRGKKPIKVKEKKIQNVEPIPSLTLEDTEKRTFTKKLRVAIGDLIQDLTGKKGPTRFSVKEEQNLVSDILAQNNKLLQRMRELRFRSKVISEEQLIKDQQKALMLMVRLESAEASSIPDTRAMDEVMYVLCDELQEAYRTGDELTAHYIWETLTYGIATGHKPLRQKEKAREAEVMQWREQKMATYLKLTEAAQNIFQYVCAVDDHTQTLSDESKDLISALEAIEKFQTESGEQARAVEEIGKMGGHESDLSGDMMNYTQNIKRSVRIFQKCEILKKKVSLLKTKMNDMQSLISSMEITLLEPNEVAKDQIMEHAQKLGAELRKRLDEQVKDIIKADAIITEYFNSVEAVFQQPALEKYITKTLDQFEAMQLQMQENEAAFARALGGNGRKIFIPGRDTVEISAQENENEQEQDQENEY